MTLEDLKAQLKGFAGRIDSMSLRERGLIFTTVLVFLYFVSMNMLFGPVTAEKDQLQRQLTQLRDETRGFEAQVQAMVGGGENNPDAAKRKKIASLQDNLKAMETSLSQVTAGLVPPKEMTRLVEQMLVKNQGLEVIKVESLPSTPLLEGTTGNVPEESMVYKHGMRIELRGNYLDILRYLRSLEELQWKVFWGQVSLQTEKYPVSRVSLLIYTLSTRQAWIGL